MAFGSFIAGATSEGGGTVAFPVLTLVFGTEPAAARDFSLMIQLVGMTAAAVTILALRIPIATGPVLLASLGGAAGMIIGLEHLAPAVPPPMAKIFFTSCWLSFGIALLLINRERQTGRRRLTSVPLGVGLEALLLIGVGFVGGLISSVTGSGLDLLTFAVLVLFFRLCEAVATPTSVVLMAINALVGFV